MIVVSDTSPLTSLLQIGHERVLLDLYGSVVIPEAVERELRRGHPGLPTFLKVISPKNRETVARLALEIDSGEAEAIALAKEVQADVLLIDEKRGRTVALREGVSVIGLLGVLIVAKKKGVIASLERMLDDLERIADFRLAPDLKSRALHETGERP